MRRIRAALEHIGAMFIEAWEHEGWWRLWWFYLLALVVFCLAIGNGLAFILALLLLVMDITDSWKNSVISQQRTIIFNLLDVVSEQWGRSGSEKVK